MKYDVIAPKGIDEKVLLDSKSLSPFSDVVLSFIDRLSNDILENKSFRRYPELMAMAFWMRKSNIMTIKNSFKHETNNRIRMARGLAFHIAPSNVDSIFIYSWFISMLMGNKNIVRLSSKTDEQVEIIISLINNIVESPEYEDVKNRFMIIRYEHNDEITSHLSSFCDIRVIWGGDETIKRIRNIPIGPSAIELVFADKFSMSLINSKAFLEGNYQTNLIDKFYNDAFWFGQNACSSPRLVVWVGNGDDVSKARMKFWNMLETKIKSEGQICPPSVAMDKLVVTQQLASESKVKIEPVTTSLINRILLKYPDDINRKLHCGGGLFYEIVLNDLNEFTGIVTKSDQTVGIYGYSAENIVKLIKEHNPEGVNRYVPIGEALSFSVTWDGYDLLQSFSKEIEISLK